MTRAQSSLFGVAVLLATLFFCDTRPNANPTSRALPLLSVADGHGLEITPYQSMTIDKSRIGDHYYSDKAPFSTLLALPLYLGWSHLHRDTPVAERLRAAVTIGVWVASSLPFFAIVMLSMHSLRFRSATLGIDPRLLIILAWFSGMVWLYAGAFFGHVLAGLFLLLAMLSYERDRLLWTGSCLAAAFVTEYPLGMALACFAAADLVSHRSPRRLLALAIGFAPGVLLVLLHNFLVTGSMVEMPYDFVATKAFVAMRTGYGFRGPNPVALLSMLFSPARGLVFYAPAMMVLAWYFVQDLHASATREHGHWLSPLIRHPAAWFAVAFPLLISSYFMWWGGWSYGPRHLVPMVVLLTFLGVRSYRGNPTRNRMLLFCSAPAVAFVVITKGTHSYMMPDSVVIPMFRTLARAANLRFNEENWLSRITGLSGATAVALSLLAMCIWIGSHAWHANKLGRTPQPRHP